VTDDDVSSRFADYELTSSPNAAAETGVLRQHLDRHWRGFVELQHLGRLLDADGSLRAALSAQEPPPPAKIQAVLSEAAHLAWLPAVAEQVPRFARIPLASYVRSLVKETVIAVVRALSLDAASKSNRKLAQARLFLLLFHSSFYAPLSPIGACWCFCRLPSGAEVPSAHRPAGGRRVARLHASGYLPAICWLVSQQSPDQPVNVGVNSRSVHD
jgi:hypothetical protein